MAFDLSQFLTDAGVKSDTKAEKQIELISIDLIVPNEKNFYTIEGIDGLANSILLCGLQQPLLVRPIPGDDSQVVIISGHRRYTALKKLVEEGHEELRDVPCIVEQTADEPEALTQLKLIMANSDTRKISSADMATQVEQIEKLLYELQQQGYSFPGRMRDYVSQICKVSAGKISNLKAIQKGLCPSARALWNSGKLSDSTALTLSKQPESRQKAIILGQTANFTKPFSMTDDHAGAVIREIERIEKLGNGTACEKLYTSTCAHVFTRLERAAQLRPYSGLNCQGCCCTCYDLINCKYSCEHAAEEKKQKRKQNQVYAAREKEKQQQADAPKIELLGKTYSRVQALRKVKGIDAKTYISTSSGHMAFQDDLLRLSDLETGRKVTTGNRLPGGIWPDEALRLIEVADMLDCSIDYLLGRTDAVKAAEVSSGGWFTGNPPKPMWCVCRIMVDGVENSMYFRYYWNGAAWLDLSEIETVTHWMPEVE